MDPSDGEAVSSSERHNIDVGLRNHPVLTSTSRVLTEFEDKGMMEGSSVL
jgi:hypothetical protein